MSNEAIRERLAKAANRKDSTRLASVADFLHHARTDIPDLLAQVDERDKRIAELEAEVKELNASLLDCEQFHRRIK